ncbi:MAG: oligosaccharide flippase family protein, partial [Planctomycetes bacterium]|nr:oligosaccharide flippase family protein [Planctomycetota bacterium]
YVYAFTWISVLALVSKLGLDTGLVRFLPAFTVHESWPQMNGILRQSTRLTLVTSLIVASSTGLAIWLFGAELAPELRYTLWLGCLVLPVLALTQLRQAALRGFKRIPRAEIPDRILRPLVMGAIVVILVTVFERHIGATAVMTAHLAALVGTFLIAHHWMARAVPQPARRATPAYETGKWLKTSLPLVFVSAAHLILSQIDVLMVGSLLGSAETGIYAVAARISSFVIFGLIAINAIAAPMISQLHAAGQHRQQLALARRKRHAVQAAAAAVGEHVAHAAAEVTATVGDGIECGGEFVDSAVLDDVAVDIATTPGVDGGRIESAADDQDLNLAVETQDHLHAVDGRAVDVVGVDQDQVGLGAQGGPDGFGVEAAIDGDPLVDSGEEASVGLPMQRPPAQNSDREFSLFHHHTAQAGGPSPLPTAGRESGRAQVVASRARIMLWVCSPSGYQVNTLSRENLGSARFASVDRLDRRVGRRR